MRPFIFRMQLREQVRHCVSKRYNWRERHRQTGRVARIKTTVVAANARQLSLSQDERLDRESSLSCQRSRHSIKILLILTTQMTAGGEQIERLNDEKNSGNGSQPRSSDAVGRTGKAGNFHSVSTEACYKVRFRRDMIDRPRKRTARAAVKGGAS